MIMLKIWNKNELLVDIFCVFVVKAGLTFQIFYASGFSVDVPVIYSQMGEGIFGQAPSIYNPVRAP